MSGKFSLEYLIYLFRCLEKHGSPENYFLFSQDGTSRIKVDYDESGTGRFRLEILHPISDARIDALVKAHSLDRAEYLNKVGSNPLVSTGSAVNAAHSMIFASPTLLNPDEAFELNFQSSLKVFLKTMANSQFPPSPLLNIPFVFVWGGYEFFRYKSFSGELNFNFHHFDLLEVGLLIINCFVFWALRTKKNTIPVFSEGTSSSFAAEKAATKSLIYLTVCLFILSAFTP